MTQRISERFWQAEARTEETKRWFLIRGFYWVIPYFVMLPFRRVKAEAAKAEAGISAEEVARQMAKEMAGAGKGGTL